MSDKISKIIKYIKSGEKETQLLGLEIEHFILDKDNRSVFYAYPDGKAGVREIIEELSTFYDEKVYENFSGQKHLVGLKRKDCEITIEPGAQFEISISAHQNIEDIEKIYKKFLEETDDVLSKHDYHLENIGYRPDACALEVPIIPKMRYAYMDANFKNVGTQGFCMMRCSAATQISIDYKDEADCIKKMKIANCLCPLIYFLLDNSPIFDRCYVGQQKDAPSGLKIPKRMVRWNIWNNADPDRCTSDQIIFDSKFDYKNYAQLISDMPEVYTPKNLKTDEEIVKHQLSMNFFDVRLKNTIEIRPADSMPIEYTFAYVELIKKLFYNEEALNKLWNIFKDAKYEDYVLAGKTLQNDEWNSNVYGQNVFDLLTKIISVAKLTDTKYLNPIEKLIKSKKCLKDYLKSNYVETKGEFNPVSNTVNNTKIQVSSFNNNEDFKNFVEKRKSSKISYMGKISTSGYFSKVFDYNNYLQFRMLVEKTSSILEKVAKEYFNNKEYRNLFYWDEYSEKLINFLPKYKPYIPIARFDIFFDDATGQFEFCEFNTGGSAAMSKATYACEEIINTAPFKKLKSALQKEGKTIKSHDVYNPWVEHFRNIYKQWCNNTNIKFKDDFTIAICDFLDNCQLPDFMPFKKYFENSENICLICDIRDLNFDGKQLYSKDGIAIDAIYKRVTLDDLINLKDDKGVNAMIDSVLSEKVCAIDWFSSQIIHDKQIFPILHLPETLKLMNKSEKEFIKLHIPKSYILNKDTANNKEFITNKNNYIIKPISSRDARNVYVGKELNAENWNNVLKTCSDSGNYIIQKFCKMHTSPNVWINPNEINKTLKGNVEQCCNMEGLYCYNKQFEGMYLRQRKQKWNATDFDMTVPVFYEVEKN